MKVLVGASSFAQQDKTALQMLEEKGFEVIPNPYGRKLTEEELVILLEGAIGLLAGLEPLTETVFAACPKLKAIARIGIGTDNVDFDVARKHNIKVSYTPDAPTYAVAELTFAALLSITRQIVPANADMHNGLWKKRMGSSLNGLTVLLIGYGRIAKTFEAMLQPFGVKIIITDPFQPELSISLEEGLAKANVISLHASGKDMILGQEQLNIVPNGTILLNSARGGLVDEIAVANALTEGKLAYYWADTFIEEPYTGILTTINNAVLTPHIATYTTLCRKEMETQAVKNLLRDLNV